MMNVDPFAPQLLLDYHYFCERFGPLSFPEFIALWHAADVMMTTALAAGFDPGGVSDFLVGDPEATVGDEDTIELVH